MLSACCRRSRQDAARDIHYHAGKTTAALVVIGYGFGLSNDRLRRILGLPHPGTVRLVDRIVVNGLVDRRAISLYLSKRGMAVRQPLLEVRLAVIRSSLTQLTDAEQETFGPLLHKMLSSMGMTDMERRTLCRLCDDRVCSDCPIPAEKLSK